MNVLLIFPFSIIEWNNKYEEPRIPLNIAYLGAAARKAGHRVSLLDLRMEQQKRSMEVTDSFDKPSVAVLTELMLERIRREKVNIVGINCLYSGLFPVVTHLAGAVKAIDREIQVVIGGIHPTIYGREILNRFHHLVDFVIAGEGEETFTALIAHLENRKSVPLDSIDGLGYVRDGEVVIHPKNQFIEDLDSLAFPAVDLLGISDYYTDTSGWHSPKNIPIHTPVPILTSRSCPKQCNFCSMHFVHGKHIRFRSERNVVDEMKRYIDEYNLTYFNITDDNLTINKKRLIRLMNLIVSENLNIQFSTENGVYISNLDEEVMDAMSNAGLARLHLAFESGSDYIRNEVIGKNVYNERIWKIRDVIVKKKYNHIFLYGYFVIGLPEETHETLDETYRLITQFPLDNYSLFYAVPFPGTRLYRQCFAEKLFTQDFFYDVNQMVERGDVGQMVKGTPCIKPYALEVEEVVAFKEQAMAYLKKQREASPVPPSSPMRYRAGSVLRDSQQTKD